MTGPYLRSGESIVLTTDRVILDEILYDAMLTSERLILIDSRYARFDPVSIPLVLIQSVRGGTAATGEQVIILAVTDPASGTSVTKNILFSQQPLENRKPDRDTWVKKFIELAVSGKEEAPEDIPPCTRKDQSFQPSVRHGLAPDRVGPRTEISRPGERARELLIRPDEPEPDGQDKTRTVVREDLQGPAPADLPAGPADLAPAQVPETPVPFSRTIEKALKSLQERHDQEAAGGAGSAGSVAIRTTSPLPEVSTGSAEPLRSAGPGIIRTTTPLPDTREFPHSPDDDSTAGPGPVPPLPEEPASRSTGTESIRTSTILPDIRTSPEPSGTDRTPSRESIPATPPEDSAPRVSEREIVRTIRLRPETHEPPQPATRDTMQDAERVSPFAGIPPAPVLPASPAREPAASPDAGASPQQARNDTAPARQEFLPSSAAPLLRHILIAGGFILLIVLLVLGTIYLPARMSPDQETLPPLTTVPSLTPAPTPVISPTIMAVPPAGVWVRVMSPGFYTGEAGNPELLQSVSGTGEHYYKVLYPDRLVKAHVEKQEDSGDLLVVEVYRNGKMISSRSISAPRGSVDLLIDPVTGNVPGETSGVPAGNATNRSDSQRVEYF